MREGPRATYTIGSTQKIHTIIQYGKVHKKKQKNNKT